MKEKKIDDKWHGFAEFIGIEDQVWTPRKIKELLQDMIESGILENADDTLLISFLDVNDAANLKHNRHSEFMKNLLPASKTKSGFKKILDYAYSEETVVDPPSLSGYSEEEGDGTDSELKTITTDGVYRETNE